jgi:hypothetical protein
MFSYAHTMISFPFIVWAICLYNKGVHFQLIVTHNCVSVCPCGWTECLSSSIVCREVEETWSYNWPGGSHGCRIRQHSIVLASAVLLICWQRPHVHCTRYKSWPALDIYYLAYRHRATTTSPCGNCDCCYALCLLHIFQVSYWFFGSTCVTKSSTRLSWCMKCYVIVLHDWSELLVYFSKKGEDILCCT